MKDNTIIYIGLGALALYLLSKRTAAPVTVPAGTAAVPMSPVVQTGMLLPLINKVVSQFTSGQAAAPQVPVNPAAGYYDASSGVTYNADGTVNDNSGTPLNVQVLNQQLSDQAAQQEAAAYVPVTDASTNSPTGQDMTFLLGDT